MKSVKTLSVVLTALLFAFVAFGSAEARRGHERQGMRGEGGPGMHWGHLHLLNKLDLSQEQKQEAAAILKSHREAIGTNSKGMMEARKNLRDAVMAEEFSEGAVRDAAAEVGRQIEESAVLSARIFSELREVLTPEQKEKMLQMREKRGGKGKYSPEGKLSALDKWIEENRK